MEGNTAIASILLLYCHIAQEGRIGLNESVHVDPRNFDPFRMIDVQVEESLEPEIDQEWLREGAAVMLAGDLLGIVGDSWGGTEFLNDDFVERCMEALARCQFEEMQRLVAALQQYPGNRFATTSDWGPVRLQENLIYENFVLRRLTGLLPHEAESRRAERSGRSVRNKILRWRKS